MLAESDDNFRKISQSSFRYSTLKFARQIKGAVLPKTGAAQS